MYIHWPWQLVANYDGKPTYSPNNYNQSKHLLSWSKQQRPVFASFVVMKSITIQPLANANLVRKQWQLHLDWNGFGCMVMSPAFQRKWCAKCHGRFPDWRDRAKNQTWKPPERRKRVWSIMFFWIVMIPCVTKCNRKCNMYKCKAIFFLQANYSAKFLQELARPFPTAVPSRKRRWWHWTLWGLAQFSFKRADDQKQKIMP